MAPETKEILVLVCDMFLNFLLNYTSLCHRLGSPHGGDSNGMPQCMGAIQIDGTMHSFTERYENISNTWPVLPNI